MCKEKFTNVSDIRMKTFNGNTLIKDVVKGYVNNGETEEGGVTSMDGKLDIRPRYQRAYIANDIPNWRENLINSILCGFPINRMYFGAEDFNLDEREVLDGQQRLITICDFYNGKFAIKIENHTYYYENLDPYLQEAFLNYNLDITHCMGDETERIKWFTRINQPNSILTAQELRNSTFIGPWVESAKKYFSAVSSHSNKLILKKEYPYYVMNYCKDKKIERGEILEMVLDWISYRDFEDLRKKTDRDERINRYMAIHQHDENANELIAYYKEVIDWVKATFGEKADTAMKKVDWGRLYVEYGNKEYNLVELNNRIAVLLSDSEVTANSNVYEYVLMGEPTDKISMLSLRSFGEREREIQKKKQRGYDPISMQPLGDKINAHHILPWDMGGKTELDNLVLLNEDTHKLVHQGLYSPSDVRNKLNELLNKF